MFRLERVRQVTVLPETFTRQAGFSVHALGAFDRYDVTVELLFDAEIAQWVRERPAFYRSTYEDTAEGLKVTFQIAHIEGVVGWVLSWGAKVRVLRPESLRERLRDELEAMQHRLQP